jgi:putative flippase GtrA
MKVVNQLAKYATVALLSATSDWLVFTALFAGLGWPILAQGISRIVGGTVSFSINKYWSFDSRHHDRTLSEAWRFLILFILSYVLSLSLFSALTYSGIWPYWSKLMTDTSCFFVNFVVMRLWVYRLHEPASSTLETDTPCMQLARGCGRIRS